MRAKKSCLLTRHFREKSWLPECWGLCIFFFLVCKTLYKWILINFCFNTWSYHRLSGTVNLQGVSCPKLCPVSAVKRGGVTAGPVGLSSSAEGTQLSGRCSSASTRCCASYSSHVCQLCISKRMLGNCWPLVLWAGWLYYIGLRQVCVSVAFSFSRRLWTVVGLGLFHLLIAFSCVKLVVLDVWDMGIHISAFSKRGADQWEGHGAVMQCKQFTHF